VVILQSAANVKSAADKFKAGLEPPNGILVGQEPARLRRQRPDLFCASRIRAMHVVHGPAADTFARDTFVVE
jgi:hypothetical protein